MNPPTYDENDPAQEFPLTLARRAELKAMIDAGEREWTRLVLGMAGELLRADDEIRALHEKLVEEPEEVEGLETGVGYLSPRVVIDQVIVLGEGFNPSAFTNSLVRAIGRER